MFHGSTPASPDCESQAHLDPRRYDAIGERWLFHPPELRVPAIPLEFPVPAVRFHSAMTETPRKSGVANAAQAA